MAAAEVPRRAQVPPRARLGADRRRRGGARGHLVRQDALGELVHYEPPDGGDTLAKDASYGEVESVKAVSDLIAPLSGEVLEVNQKVVDAPETVNEDPVRRRLAHPHPALRASEVDALLDVAVTSRSCRAVTHPLSSR